MELSIPIPNFPPFKLRSSLIDKDPVIWEHLLQDYLVLFQKLLAILPPNAKTAPKYTLSTQTKTQLHLFINTFLQESADESGQVFSLGAINPNIRQNQHLLKLAVFAYIKKCNLVNLKIQGKSAWNFLKVYLTMAESFASAKINQSFINVAIIRKLVIGDTKSNVNGKSDDVSLIKSIQDHLGHTIASGKWHKHGEDDLILYLLLGSKTKKSLNSNQNKGPKRINKPQNGSNEGDFAERFVDLHWIEVVSDIYANGEGLYAKLCVQIMSFSLCALNSNKVINLLKNLECKTLDQLKTLYPLVSKVVLSKTFNDLNPDIKNLLSFLRTKVSAERKFDESKIASIEMMFPQLTTGQIKTVLVNHKDDVESAINSLLEMDNLDSIKEYQKEQKQKKQPKPTNVVDFQLNKDTKVEVMFGKKQTNFEDMDQDLRKKTLAMLYDAQEDEPDDTYLENEITSGGGKAPREETSIQEQTLFGLFKTNRSALDRSDRNSASRIELKRELKWTDEQIEGWARMLEKSPARFRDLEERLVYVDGNLNANTGKKSTKWTSSEGGEDKRRGNRLPIKDNSNFQHYNDKKKVQRSNEKNKSKIGNHNRKDKSAAKN